jgi:putative transcriptional regulator
MYWNINQLDFACLAAGVPLACLPSCARSAEMGDISPSQNPTCPQFQPNERSIASLVNVGSPTNIDVMLARQKMSVTYLAERVGITMANISILTGGKAKAIRLSTLEAICKALECQPGDILEFI